MSLFNNENINMTRGKPLRQLLLFSLPLILGNLFQQLYTVTDTAIVGRGVGLTALAALGAVDWLAWLPFCVPQGFAQGFSVKVSQKYGEGDLPGVRHAVGQSFRMTFIIGVLCTAAGLLGLPFLLDILRVREELQPLANVYLTILYAGFLITAVYNTAASVLRAVGDSRTPLIAMVTASLLNIGLDSLTVFVLKWGIAGAAGATVFAQAVACILCLIKVRKTPSLCFDRAQLRRDGKVSLELVRLGFPMCLMNIIICVGGLIVLSVVNGCSIAFIAGYTATNKLYGLLEVCAISFSYAVTTFVGQNYGAGQFRRIRSGVVTSLLMSVVTAVGIGLAMILFGRAITGLFLTSEDPSVLALAGDTAYLYLEVMSIFLPTLYVLYAYRAALQGLGNTLIPMLSGIAEFVVRVGVAFLVTRSGHETGIFFAETGAWVAAAILQCVAYYILRRKYPKEDRPLSE